MMWSLFFWFFMWMIYMEMMWSKYMGMMWRMMMLRSRVLILFFWGPSCGFALDARNERSKLSMTMMVVVVGFSWHRNRMGELFRQTLSSKY